jgi:hypothetical protein
MDNPRFSSWFVTILQSFYAEVDEIYNSGLAVHYQYNPIKRLRLRLWGAITLGLAKRVKAKICSEYQWVMSYGSSATY